MLILCQELIGNLKKIFKNGKLLETLPTDTQEMRCFILRYLWHDMINTKIDKGDSESHQGNPSAATATAIEQAQNNPLSWDSSF